MNHQPFSPEPRDSDTSPTYCLQAAAYWIFRADETGDPDDVIAAQRWEHRTETLYKSRENR